MNKLREEVEPAPRFWCHCGVEELITRNRDGSFIEEMRCPGCDRIWRKADLSFPAWASTDTYLRREGEGSSYRSTLARYQACVHQLLDLFDDDPLPSNSPAQSYIERLEALIELEALQSVPTLHARAVAKLREKRLAQKPLKLRGVPCPACEGVDTRDMKALKCGRCGGTGEIL